MARYIDGSTTWTGNDMAPGALSGATATGTAFTYAAIVKKISANGGYAGFGVGYAGTPGAEVWSLSVNNAGTSADSLEWTVAGSVTWTTSVKVTSADGWVLIAGSRAAGSGALSPRLHKYSYATNTWTHANATGTLSGNANSLSVIWQGNDVGQYHIAVSGVWKRVLSDAEIENLPFSLPGWHSARPDGLWLYDQADTSQTVIDLSGNGSNQQALYGSPAVSTDSVPILGYGAPVILRTRQAPAGAAPTYRASSGAQAFGAASSAALTIPSAVAIGDRMYLVATLKQLTGSGTINTPSGWSVLAAAVNGPSGNSFQGAVFYKDAVSGDPGSTVTVTASAGSQQLTVAHSAYSGVTGHRASSWTVGSTTSATSVVCPAPGTAPQSNDLVVLVGAVRETVNGPASNPTFTGPAGASIRGQIAGTSGSAQNVASFIGDHDNTSGDRTVTASQTSVEISGQIILQGSTGSSLSSSMAETLTIADAMAAGVALPRSAGESVTLGHTLSAGVVLARAMSESVTSGDAWAANVALPRGMSGSVTSGDAWASSVNRPAVMSGSLTSSDGWARSLALPRGMAESVTSGDAWARGLALPRAMPESLTSADSWAAGGSTRSRSLAESIALANVLAATTAKPRSLSESVTLGDAVAATSAQPRGMAETLTLGNAAAAVRALTRGVAESLTSSDAWERTAARLLGTSGAVTAGDAWGRQVALPRSLGDALSLVGSYGIGSGVTLSMGEAVTLADAFSRQAAAPRNMGEGMSLDVATSYTVALNIAASDSISVADDWFGGMVVLVGMAESIGVADSFDRGAASYPRDQAATVTLAHSFGRQATLARAIGQSLTVGDGWARAVGQPRGLAEAVTAADAWAALRAIVRTLAESVTAGHAFTRQTARPRGIGQSLTLTDAWARGTALNAGVGESVHLADVIQRAATTLNAGMAQGLTLGHAFARQATMARALSETLTLADEVVAMRAIIPVAMAEGIAFSSQLATRMARARGLSEPLALGDGWARQSARNPKMFESVTLDGLMAKTTAVTLPVQIGQIAFDDLLAVTGIALVRVWREDLALAGEIVRVVTADVIPVAYPHYVTMTISPWQIAGTVVRDVEEGIRRTV